LSARLGGFHPIGDVSTAIKPDGKGAAFTI